jgi:DNA-binding CsgD family transcriptional regulator
MAGALAQTTAADRTAARVKVLVDAGGMAWIQDDYSTARTQLEEGMMIAREQGAQQLIAKALVCLGGVALAQHDLTLAIAHRTEALAIARVLGDKFTIAGTLIHLGSVACEQNNYVQAHSLYQEALGLYQELRAEWSIADALHYLGQVARHQRDYTQARALFQESLARWCALGTIQWAGVAECLDGLGCVYAFQRQFVWAVRLFGAAEALRGVLAMPPFPLTRSSAADECAAVRAQLDEAAFAEAWTAGHGLSTEQAIEYAVALPESSASTPSTLDPSPVSPAPKAYPAGLTAREVEVLRLLAQGLTYAQIADALVISRRTVNRHLTTIYTKLIVTSRHAATRFALDHHLV